MSPSDALQADGAAGGLQQESGGAIQLNGRCVRKAEGLEEDVAVKPWREGGRVAELQHRGSGVGEPWHKVRGVVEPLG